MNHFTIHLKMFHGFAKYLPAEAKGGMASITLAENGTLEDLLSLLGIAPDQPKIILINGHSQGVCTIMQTNVALHNGDTVAIFPPVAGG